jgi:pimeloyl-ACP methyl ester carboxylesterase
MTKVRFKKAVKIVGIIIASLIALIILIFFGIIRGIVPAVTRANHEITAPSGIDQMEIAEIGGIRQALYFRGQNVENPIILILHGGPGFPLMPFLHEFQYDWEHDFTVVHWDQRNAGKTYFANDPKAVSGTIEPQRVVQDAHEVTQYIKQKLNKDKIVIMGHSWGSVLGTMLVQAYPEDYIAYIGVGQAVNMRDTIRVGYEKTLEAARAAGKQRDVAALEALAPCPPPGGYNETYQKKVLEFQKYLEKYDMGMGGNGLIIPLLTTPYYSLSDLRFVLLTDKSIQGDLMRYLVEDFDVTDFGLSYNVPVYYIMGENDYQTPCPLAEELYAKISAPDKAFFSITDAGHMSMTDNKDEFTRVLLEEIKPKLQGKME